MQVTTMKRLSVVFGLTLALAFSMMFQATQADAQTATVRLKLISLVCHDTEDWTGADEAYLLVKGRRIWGPQSMNDNDAADLRGVFPVSFTSSARIDLYDQDAGWFDNDDHLGTAYAYASQVGTGEKQVSFTKSGASYTLFFEVIR